MGRNTPYAQSVPRSGFSYTGRRAVADQGARGSVPGSKVRG